jgi:hypothetical protein
MKTLNYIIVLSLIGFSLSCTESVGPQGPQGAQGADGPQGPIGAAGESGFVFEYTEVDFTTANNYEVYLDYPTDFEGVDSDVALVYLLWDVSTDGDGNALEVWRQVPQTLLTSNGLLQYNFDFTKFDVHLFLSAEFNLDLLQPIDTDNWIVRVVIVPGTFWDGRSSVDHNDYTAVKEAYGLPDLGEHTAISRRN